MSYENINPLDATARGLKILRNIKECPVPKESEKLNKLMEKISNLDVTEETLETLAKGIAVSMQADRFCDQQVTRRKILAFEEDEELDALTKRASDLVKKIQEAIRQHDTKVIELQDVLQERWNMTVKKYGLNPKDRLYSIDDTVGVIDLIDLRCDGCKGATKIRKTRQAVDEALATLKRKEEKNDKPREGRQPEDAGDD